jgi:hypothetical protein
MSTFSPVIEQEKLPLLPNLKTAFCYQIVIYFLLCPPGGYLRCSLLFTFQVACPYRTEGLPLFESLRLRAPCLRQARNKEARSPNEIYLNHTVGIRPLYSWLRGRAAKLRYSRGRRIRTTIKNFEDFYSNH